VSTAESAGGDSGVPALLDAFRGSSVIDERLTVGWVEQHDERIACVSGILLGHWQHRRM
jgi:hypothetical protein